MNKSLLIWGTGGHGKVVLDIAQLSERFERITFVDDDPVKTGGSFCGCPVLAGVQDIEAFTGHPFVAAIGNNQARAFCLKRARERGLDPTTLVHPSAVIAASATIAPGTVVMPGAIVNAGASIGENCIVNSGSIVEHDCVIGAHVHISPRAVLGGGVVVDPYAHVGIGAVVLPLARVGEGSVVGAGAVVLREVPPRSTVAGVPARTLSTTTHRIQ